MDGREGLLSQFVEKTNADPSFAQDLLEATGWDLEAAVSAFNGLSVTSEPQNYQFEDPDFALSEYDEIQMEEVTSGGGNASSSGSSSLPSPEKKQVKKRSTKKRKPTKGLASVADDVGSVFLRVAVSQAKLRIGVEHKEQVFDEQFFKHSFLHPDFSSEPEDLQKFIDSDIREMSHKHTLEKSGRLNWWASTGKLPTLEPLATSGDGNCLLHAASLYMWGLPDQDLILRTHLHRMLTDSIQKEGIHRRWKYLTDSRNQEAGGLTFSEEEWEFEWHEIMRICTNQTRRRPTTDSLRRYSTLRPHYESLEEVHVFGLSHVLRRPIIIVADEYLRDMNGEPLAPIYFGGIYLPLEWSPPSCFKSPLVLAYDSSHFSPLVAKKDLEIAQKQKKNSRLRHMQSKQDTVMPLVDPNGSLLPILFAYDPKKPSDYPQKWSNTKCPAGEFPDRIVALLESYMDIRWIQLHIGAKFGSHNEFPDKDSVTIPVKVPKVRFPASVVSTIGEPEYQAVLVSKYLDDVRKRFEEDKIKQEKIAANRARQEEEMRRIEASRPVPCEGKGCTLYGTPATDNLCSQCYSLSKKNKSPGAYERSVSVPAAGQSSQPLSKEPTPPPLTHSTRPPELITRQNLATNDKNSAKQSSPAQRRRLSPPSTPPPPPPRSDSSQPQPLSPTAQLYKQVPSSPKTDPPPPTLLPNVSYSSPTRKAEVKSPGHSSCGGYSRDHIKPITLDEGGGSPYVPGSDRSRCKTSGCDFFGRPETNGFCSGCYNSGKETLV